MASDLQNLEPLAVVAQGVEYGDPAGQLFFERARILLSQAAARERAHRYALNLAHYALNTEGLPEIALDEALMVVDDALNL